ncbi:hypothetical protein [Brevibacillus parabrevis]
MTLLYNNVVQGKIAYDTLPKDQQAMLKSFSDNLKKNAFKEYNPITEFTQGFAAGFLATVEVVEVVYTARGYIAYRSTKGTNASSQGSLTIVEAKGVTFSASEKNAAKYMQSLGNNVTLRAPSGTRAGGGTSDLVVNGVNYDVYTPTTANVSRIISAIAKKNSQTSGVVLDLSQTTVTAEQLGDVLARVRGTGATNIIDIVIMK